MPLKKHRSSTDDEKNRLSTDSAISDDFQLVDDEQSKFFNPFNITSIFNKLIKEGEEDNSEFNPATFNQLIKEGDNEFNSATKLLLSLTMSTERQDMMEKAGFYKQYGEFFGFKLPKTADKTTDKTADDIADQLIAIARKEASIGSKIESLLDKKSEDKKIDRNILYLSLAFILANDSKLKIDILLSLIELYKEKENHPFFLRCCYEIVFLNNKIDLKGVKGSLLTTIEMFKQHFQFIQSHPDLKQELFDLPYIKNKNHYLMQVKFKIAEAYVDSFLKDRKMLSHISDENNKPLANNCEIVNLEKFVYGFNEILSTEETFSEACEKFIAHLAALKYQLEKTDLLTQFIKKDKSFDYSLLINLIDNFILVYSSFINNPFNHIQSINATKPEEVTPAALKEKMDRLKIAYFSTAEMRGQAFELSTLLLTFWNSHPLLKNQLEGWLRDHRKDLHSLSDYIISPLQRGPRYPLLFQEVKKHVNSPSWDNLFEKSRSDCELINESVRDEENFRSLTASNKKYFAGLLKSLRVGLKNKMNIIAKQCEIAILQGKLAVKEKENITGPQGVNKNLQQEIVKLQALQLQQHEQLETVITRKNELEELYLAKQKENLALQQQVETLSNQLKTLQLESQRQLLKANEEVAQLKSLQEKTNKNQFQPLLIDEKEIKPLASPEETVGELVKAVERANDKLVGKLLDDYITERNKEGKPEYYFWGRIFKPFSFSKTVKTGVAAKIKNYLQSIANNENLQLAYNTQKFSSDELRAAGEGQLGDLINQYAAQSASLSSLKKVIEDASAPLAAELRP